MGGMVDQSIKWKRVSTEFVLLVLGVLVALGVDRWVQGLDENRIERDYLERLESDVASNVSTFEFMLSDWEATQQAASDLISILEDPGSRPSDVGLLIVVARAGTTNTGPAQDSNFKDLSTTGNLRLIEDGELRSALVRYFGHQIWAGRPSMDRLDLRFRTFANEHLPVEWIMGHRDLCPASTPAFDCIAADPPSADLIWNTLIHDPSMPRVLNSVKNHAAREVRNLRRWLQQSEGMQEILRSALGS
jgi:hypothetical protein